MAQVDLFTYFVIVFWTFTIFILSFVFFISYFFPTFFYPFYLFNKWFMHMFVFAHMVHGSMFLSLNSFVFIELLDFLQELLD